MLNIANTVSPNSVINAVADIKKKREFGGYGCFDNKSIHLKGDLAKAFLEFTSMVPNKKSKKGKSLRFSDVNYDQCIICRGLMRNQS